MRFFILLTFFYLFIQTVQTHNRKLLHSNHKRFRKKDLITQLPRSKLLDAILNHAATQIMSSMLETGDKRRNLPSKDDKIYNLGELFDDSSAQRLLSRKLKSKGSIFDPFAGSDDPYKDYDKGENDHNILKNQKFSGIVDLIKNNGLKEFTSGSSEYKLSESNNKLEETKLKDISELTKENISMKRNESNRANSRNQVSEILPDQDGSIELLKSRDNNDEVKLTAPNLYFDAKINTSDNREMIVKELQNVLKVISHLNFNDAGIDSTRNNVKDITLAQSDKRNSAGKILTSAETNIIDKSFTNKNESSKQSLNENIKDGKNQERSTKDDSAPSDAMYPTSGSHLIQHHGSLYKIEKIPDEILSSFNNNDKRIQLQDRFKERIEFNRQHHNAESILPQTPIGAFRNIGMDTSLQEPPDKQLKAVQRSSPLQIDDSEKSNHQEAPLPLDEVGQSSVAETYEIKHNNRLFRITEITSDVRQPLQEESPETRSVSNTTNTPNSRNSVVQIESSEIRPVTNQENPHDSIISGVSFPSNNSIIEHQNIAVNSNYNTNRIETALRSNTQTNFVKSVTSSAPPHVQNTSGNVMVSNKTPTFKIDQYMVDSKNSNILLNENKQNVKVDSKTSVDENKYLITNNPDVKPLEVIPPEDFISKDNSTELLFDDKEGENSLPSTPDNNNREYFLKQPRNGDKTVEFRHRAINQTDGNEDDYVAYVFKTNRVNNDDTENLNSTLYQDVTP